jgi:tetratricopeptide (TPR) repeat protein
MTALLALLLSAASPGPSPSERFDEANALYRTGEIAAAAQAYEALLADGLTSPALQLNLGNARMRLGRRGGAIACWERALRLDPGDDDARANLLAARSDDPDRALAGEPPFFARLVGRTSDGLAVALFALPWWVLWGALALRGDRRGRQRRLLTACALASALAVLAGGALLAGRAVDRRLPAAVVVAASVRVREGPSPALQSAFELHEGTRVRLLEARGDSVRIRLDGGAEGWTARDGVEPL